jgi:hypothetical protein
MICLRIIQGKGGRSRDGFVLLEIYFRERSTGYFMSKRREKKKKKGKAMFTLFFLFSSLARLLGFGLLVSSCSIYIESPLTILFIYNNQIN